MNLTLIPSVVLIIGLSAPVLSSAQAITRRAQLRDSLVAGNVRMSRVVDSLRHAADRLDTLVESSDHMVNFLKTSHDTAELPGWIRIHDHLSKQFDSTLQQLDTSIGLLNRLSKALDSLLSTPAHRKNYPK